jgi:3-oxoacyl-[acyl-carrier-protein] synthase-1
MSQPVYITGMGAICAAGTNVDSGFDAIKNCLDNIKPLTLFDSGLNTTPVCAQIQENIDLQHKSSYRTLSLALIAAQEAMSVLQNHEGIRLGIIASTTVGGISVTERIYEQFKKDPLIKIDNRLLAIHEPTVLSSEICKHFKGSGFHTISTACSTGLHAIGIAKRFIENDIYDCCLAIGADALSLLTVRGFASLTLLDSNGCRPFDKRRAGISLGEGAAAMLITSEKYMHRCSGKVLARVSGWGATADSFHMTAPHPDGDGAARAIRAALCEAAIEPQQIDLVVTHGTATPDNDKAEVKAMRSVMPKLPPFCSMKRTLGHTLAASGILEAVFGVKALQNNLIPPTAGFEQLDEEIGVAPAISDSSKELHHVLKNSFGFGGNNAAVLFSKVE